jgi:uncharacterized membrane protein
MTRNAEDEDAGIAVSRGFFLLLILGFILVFVGITIVLVASMLLGGSASFGAVIFIGPFPIVIGAGPEATLLVLLGIILAVVSVVMLLVMRRKVRVSGS